RRRRCPGPRAGARIRAAAPGPRTGGAADPTAARDDRPDRTPAAARDPAAPPPGPHPARPPAPPPPPTIPQLAWSATSPVAGEPAKVKEGQRLHFEAAVAQAGGEPRPGGGGVLRRRGRG